MRRASRSSGQHALALTPVAKTPQAIQGAYNELMLKETLKLTGLVTGSNGLLLSPAKTSALSSRRRSSSPRRAFFAGIDLDDGMLSDGDSDAGNDLLAALGTFSASMQNATGTQRGTQEDLDRKAQMLYTKTLEDQGFYEVQTLSDELQVLRLENKLLCMQHGSVTHLMPKRIKSGDADWQAQATLAPEREQQLKRRIEHLKGRIGKLESENDSMRRSSAAERSTYEARIRELLAQKKAGCGCAVS